LNRIDPAKARRMSGPSDPARPDQRRQYLRGNSSDWIRSGNSPIHRHGVYARRVIPDGTHIVEYLGRRITKAAARQRELQRIERLRRGGDGSVYIFELNRRYDLDGSGRENIARLINHSCAPNCRAENIRGRIVIIARREILAGEELTFDYGYPFSEWPLHPCRCGAARCVGYIVNAAQRWRVRRISRSQRKVIAEAAATAVAGALRKHIR